MEVRTHFSWAQALNDRDIWRTRVSNGTKERVTRGGGFVASQSVDGRTLLYTSNAVRFTAHGAALTGGAPRQIIACVAGAAFAVHQRGVYYIPCSGTPTPDPNPPVHLMNPATGEHHEIGSLEKFQYESHPLRFAVSPDGRTILYGRLVRDDADLMMIENFR